MFWFIQEEWWAWTFSFSRSFLKSAQTTFTETMLHYLKKEDLLLISTQRALLGNISPSLKKVYVQQKENGIFLHFFYESPISELDAELASCTETEMIADYWQENLIETYLHCFGDPVEIAKSFGTCVYARYETENTSEKTKPLESTELGKIFSEDR